MIIQTKFPTILLFISIHLRVVKCKSNPILEDLNKISPLLFDAFSRWPFTYGQVKTELNNYLRLNHEVLSNLTHTIRSVISNVTSHMENLEMAGEFIRDHLHSGSETNLNENFLVSFPAVNENLVLENTCRLSALSCINSVVKMAK